jgi:hypothetical protein
VRLGAKQARSRAGRAERGAVAAPSRRDRPALCAQGRHHARRGQRHDLGALQAQDNAFRAASEITTASGRPAQADRLHRLWVPESSSSQCEQAVFVDCATDARLSSYAVLLKIGWFG